MLGWFKKKFGKQPVEPPPEPAAELETGAEEVAVAVEEPGHAETVATAVEQVESVDLVEPVEPVEPVELVESVEPVESVESVEPTEPVGPEELVESVEAAVADEEAALPGGADQSEPEPPVGLEPPVEAEPALAEPETAAAETAPAACEEVVDEAGGPVVEELVAGEHPDAEAEEPLAEQHAETEVEEFGEAAIVPEETEDVAIPAPVDEQIGEIVVEVQEETIPVEEEATAFFEEEMALTDEESAPVEEETVLAEEEVPPTDEEAEPEIIASTDIETVTETADADSAPTPPPGPRDKPASKSLFRRLQDRLGKTRDALVYRLDRLFLGKKEIDQDLFDQLEEILITADLGVATTMELLDIARKKVKRDQLSDPQALKVILRDQILAYIEASEQPAELVMPDEGPFVIMVVGVNGVGKTTTIGKLAAKFVRSGQSVLLVAADTFRAAAINQLKIWGERVGVEVVAQQPGSDPSSVVFDGLGHGAAHQYDVVIIDTAGRLHTSVNLMEELKKIKRVIGKKMDGAPHEVMLVLDATTGQNGIAQAKLFHETVGVTGLALTKLDGTAKGGIVANVCREIKIPVRFIGIGEQIDDLRDFDAREFVEALVAGRDDR